MRLRTGLGRLARRLLPPPPRSREEVIADFHRLFYGTVATTWDDTRWMGAKVLKCPLDLWVYQEIIAETRPDLIIESGTRHGGSALFFAGLCDLLDRGRVLSIDIAPDRPPQHPRITYLLGSSLSTSVIEAVEHAVAAAPTVMVTLDSDHQASHVLAELRQYHRYVTPGQYLIVEDTNLNGHPVSPSFGPGPREALEIFLRENPTFVSDRKREKFLLTFHERGFLRKLA